MPTLSEINADENSAQGPVVPDVEVPEFDPMLLLAAQTQFAGLVAGSPELTRLINGFGPALFATALFTFCEEYVIDEDHPDGMVATKSAVEAESAAIGILRGVANAMGKLNDDLTSEPSDAEIDEDTEITPV